MLTTLISETTWKAFITDYTYFWDYIKNNFTIANTDYTDFHVKNGFIIDHTDNANIQDLVKNTQH